jgi:hypothetical protein
MCALLCSYAYTCIGPRAALAERGGGREEGDPKATGGADDLAKDGGEVSWWRASRTVLPIPRFFMAFQLEFELNSNGFGRFKLSIICYACSSRVLGRCCRAGALSGGSLSSHQLGTQDIGMLAENSRRTTTTWHGKGNIWIRGVMDLSCGALPPLGPFGRFSFSSRFLQFYEHSASRMVATN